MSTVVRRRWVSDHSGPSRRDNRGCEYEAYVPDPLVGRRFLIEAEVAADITDAEVAIAHLNAEASSLVDTESLACILLRAESVASSKIEGLEIGARRLLRAEAARQLGEDPSDVTAVEVLANIDAMAFAIAEVATRTAITTELVLGVHRRLLVGTRFEEHGGVLRTQQNWIGGSSFNPCSAAFVPPPYERVADLVDDLVAFCNEDSLPAVAQAAIAHSQFETIHPFIDGNGRTGRALIHLVFRRRGIAPRLVPPVSLILATWAKDYIEGLDATRYRGPAGSKAMHDGINLWLGRFAGACKRAVADASDFERRTHEIEAEWRQRLGRVRAHSSVDLLIRRLVGAPLLTVASAAALTGTSFVHTNEAVARLVEAGILRQVTLGRRNRAFEAPDIVAAFTDLEHQLASPAGDTRTSEPQRRVPRRR